MTRAEAATGRHPARTARQQAGRQGDRAHAKGSSWARCMAQFRAGLVPVAADAAPPPAREIVGWLP